MTFPGLALAGLWHSARTQDKWLMFVLYQNHLGSLLGSDPWPPPWNFFSLGPKEAPDIYISARLVGDSMQVESAAHILKTLCWTSTKDFPSSSQNRRAIYFSKGKGRRDVNGDHSRKAKLQHEKYLENGRQRGRDWSGRGRWRWWELVMLGGGRQTGFGIHARIFLVGLSKSQFSNGLFILING